MPLADHLERVVLIAGIVALLLFSGIGVARVVGAARRLKKRLEGYRTLPVAKDFELAQARIAAARERGAALPELLTRAHVALADLEAQRLRIVAIARSFGWAYRFAGVLLRRR